MKAIFTILFTLTSISSYAGLERLKAQCFNEIIKKKLEIKKTAPYWLHDRIFSHEIKLNTEDVDKYHPAPRLGKQILEKKTKLDGFTDLKFISLNTDQAYIEPTVSFYLSPEYEYTLNYRSSDYIDYRITLKNAVIYIDEGINKVNNKEYTRLRCFLSPHQVETRKGVLRFDKTAKHNFYLYNEQYPYAIYTHGGFCAKGLGPLGGVVDC